MLCGGLAPHWYTLTSSRRYQILRPPNHKSFRRLLAVIVQSTQQLLLEKWTFLSELHLYFCLWNQIVFPGASALYFMHAVGVICNTCLGATATNQMPSSSLLRWGHKTAKHYQQQILIFSQKIAAVVIFPMQRLISRDRRKCYCRTVGWVGSVPC